jgi:hypothetical protein
MGNYIQESNFLVSRREAFRYIRRSERSWKEFLNDCGDQEFYRVEEILFWLDM